MKTTENPFWFYDGGVGMCKWIWFWVEMAGIPTKDCPEDYR